MISFVRNGNKVVVKIEHGIFLSNDYFDLELHQDYDYQAELLRRAFQENLNEHIIKIKRKAYEDGWKDAKAKRKKSDYFYGGWQK